MTGGKISSVAGPMFKKVSLELGGKNAGIVFPEADIDAAVAGLTRAAFTNQGEVCLACSRVFVHEDVFETFLEKFVQRVKDTIQVRMSLRVVRCTLQHTEHTVSTKHARC